MKKTGLLALVLGVLLVAGCAGTAQEEPAPVEDKSGAAGTAGAEDKAAAEARALAEAERAGLLGKTRVYFAFDSSAVDDEGRAIVEAHAAHLANNPGIRVTLEGHADERGTREYNLALGERRAQAVQKLMGTLGVGGNRVTTVSFGEEKPVDPDHNESAWRQNRRVEIVYQR